MSLKATEIMFLLGLFAVFAGFWMRFGLDFGLISGGFVLLFAAFRNAAERDGGTK